MSSFISNYSRFILIRSFVWPTFPFDYDVPVLRHLFGTSKKIPAAQFWNLRCIIASGQQDLQKHHENQLWTLNPVSTLIKGFQKCVVRSYTSKTLVKHVIFSLFKKHTFYLFLKVFQIFWFSLNDSNYQILFNKCRNLLKVHVC